MSDPDGLEGVVAGETRLSDVDGEAGELVIAGFPLETLATNARFEETAFALWNDRLPTTPELEALEAELRAHRSLADGTLDVVRVAADDAAAGPMDALRMGAATASLGIDPADETTARALLAKLPTIAAAYSRLSAGEAPVAPNEGLGHAANYLYMLAGEPPDDAVVRGLETYLTAVADHGFNASTFTARIIVSTESDLVSGVTGAIGALKGPLHGGAPGPVLETLRTIADRGDPAAVLRERLEAGERLMGFGHRVYRVRDPRAAVLSAAARRVYAADPAADPDLYDLAERVETVGVDLLAEYKPGRRLETNVEFYTAVLLAGVGIPADLFTATFAVGRVAGWTAHCLEQRADNRLIRPESRYVGDRDRSWVPLEDR